MNEPNRTGYLRHLLEKILHNLATPPVLRRATLQILLDLEPDEAPLKISRTGARELAELVNRALTEAPDAAKQTLVHALKEMVEESPFFERIEPSSVYAVLLAHCNHELTEATR